ncbi:16S rRNA (cytidine(1402)-2'-O)-methyltransferase [Buchnera aphidicola]|uniref:16S rRNA (cytidine(1402)-2'-O)-methyltransferase n=1 Tax=Buchnera aphidicola TaxID=9 RepID=UPI003967369E
MALVSNAGTPVVNDPGYPLIQKCHKKNITVIPLPGACAAITALSASGIPSNQFCYKGFIPKKKIKRINFLQKLKTKQTTTIIYESCHRILDSLKDIITILGPDKKITLAKEITKKWEKIKYGKSQNILLWLKNNQLKQKGEIIIIIKGYKKKNIHFLPKKILNTFLLLNSEISITKSIQLTALIHKTNKNELYKNIIQYIKNDKK